MKIGFFILLLFVSSPLFAQDLPKALRILEKEPQNLDDVENLIRYNWIDKAAIALQQFPQEEEKARYLTAIIRMYRGQYEKALPLFESIATATEGDHLKRESLLRKAIILSRTKRYQEALSLYERLAGEEKKEKEKERIRLMGFKTTLVAKDYNRGLKFLQGVKGAKGEWWRGWCQYRLGNPDEALRHWQKIRRHRGYGYYPRALFWQATLLEKRGEKEVAQKKIDKLLEDYPANYYALTVCGEKKDAFPKVPQASVGHLQGGPSEGPPSKCRTPAGEGKDYPRLFGEFVYPQAKKRGLDPYLIFAMIRQESRFNPYASSPAGAMGLMQIIPQTALKLAKNLGKKNFEWRDMFNPAVNIEFGSYYVRFLKKRLPGHLPFLLISYNAGEGALKRWLRAKKAKDPMFVFIEEIPYDETRDYTQKVLANYWIYRQTYLP